MTIDFQCGNCGRALRVKPEHAGKRFRCPDCNTELQAPYPATAAQSPPPKPPAPPASPTQNAGFQIDTGVDRGPAISVNRSVSSRFRKSTKYAVQNGVGSIIAAVLAIGANLLCCIAPFLALMFQGAMAVIGIMLALNSRDAWKIIGLIVNILVLVWTVTIFIMILVGLSVQDLQQMV